MDNGRPAWWAFSAVAAIAVAGVLGGCGQQAATGEGEGADAPTTAAAGAEPEAPAGRVGAPETTSGAATAAEPEPCSLVSASAVAKVIGAAENAPDTLELGGFRTCHVVGATASLEVAIGPGSGPTLNLMIAEAKGKPIAGLGDRAFEGASGRKFGFIVVKDGRALSIVAGEKADRGAVRAALDEAMKSLSWS